VPISRLLESKKINPIFKAFLHFFFVKRKLFYFLILLDKFNETQFFIIFAVPILRRSV